MEKKYESDALQHTPSFDQMVGLIKKLFTDYLQDILKSTPEEIEKSWERYKTLNHLWRDEPHGPMWVKASDRLPGIKSPVKWREGEREMKVKPVWYMLLDSNSQYLSKCEWLDESGTPDPLTQERADFIREVNGRDLVSMATPAAGREECDAQTFLKWITYDSFLELIGGQWTAKTDVNSTNPFTQERILELFNERRPAEWSGEKEVNNG